MLTDDSASQRPDELVSSISAAHTRVRGLVDGLDDGRIREASALPGWTRGHVLAHLTDNARAFDRQARSALRGELVDMYDGGPQERDAAIERGAFRSAAQHRVELSRAQEDLERTWGRLRAEDWNRPVRFRHATVLDTALARWREAEIHAVDLALDLTPRDWPQPFVLHTLDFLAPRVPAGFRLTLRAEDADFTSVLGDGTPVEVVGAARDLAAWMAGRATDGELRTSAHRLPKLGPWPPDPAE